MAWWIEYCNVFLCYGNFAVSIFFSMFNWKQTVLQIMCFQNLYFIYQTFFFLFVVAFFHRICMMMKVGWQEWHGFSLRATATTTTTKKTYEFLAVLLFYYFKVFHCDYVGLPELFVIRFTVVGRRLLNRGNIMLFLSKFI